MQSSLERSAPQMNISAFFEHLDNLFKTNQISEVEPYILAQMVVANQEHDTNASLAIANELVGFYRSQERFDEAIRVAQQAIDLCAHEYILGSIAHATTLLNGATAYRFAGQTEKALEWFKQAEAIYREKLSPMDEHYAGLYNNMSAAYSDLGQNEQSAEYLLRAAAIMDALPNRAKEAAITHANLAALYAKMQNWYGAKSHIATACDLLRDRPDAAAEYTQFSALKTMFDQH